MITLEDIKLEVPKFLVNEATYTRVSTWTYWVLRDMLASYNFWWNQRRTTLTTVASQSDYFLTTRLNGKQVLYMGDEGNQGKEIKEVMLEDIYRYDSTPTDTGDPEVWAADGMYDVQAVSTAAAVASCVSSDNNDQSIYVAIKGLVNGIDRTERVSLTGTTPALGLLTWDVGSVYSVTLSEECAGNITVTIGAVNIVAIPAGQKRIQCLKIKLWRTPDSILTLPYIYYQKPIKPVYSSDIVEIPDEAMKPLITGIMYYGHLNNGDIDFANNTWSQYKEEKSELYINSSRELNIVTEKNFNAKDSRLVFTLPDIINGVAP